MSLVPSFIAKLSRAEKHLADLQVAIHEYGAGPPHPYAVRKRIEREREVYRLEFSRSPANTDIPLIATDAIYNMRSSLEHLIAALAAAKDRDRLTFPIYWRGVWDPDIEGENRRRRKARHVWRAIEAALAPEAVTHLKRLQPPDDAGDDEEDHDLRILNRLSNTDRHSKLPVAAAGLRDLTMDWQFKDGTSQVGIGTVNPGSFLEDGAEVTKPPEDAVGVEAQGSPLVVIRLREKSKERPSVNIILPDELTRTTGWIRREVVMPLLPYVRG